MADSPIKHRSFSAPPPLQLFHELSFASLHTLNLALELLVLEFDDIVGRSLSVDTLLIANSPSLLLDFP